METTQYASKGRTYRETQAKQFHSDCLPYHSEGMSIGMKDFLDGGYETPRKTQGSPLIDKRVVGASPRGHCGCPGAGVNRRPSDSWLAALGAKYVSLCAFSRSAGHSRLQPHPRPQSQFRHGSRNASRSMRTTKQIVPRQQTRNCSISPGCFQEASNRFQCALRAAMRSRKAPATYGFWNCDQAPSAFISRGGPSSVLSAQEESVPTTAQRHPPALKILDI